MTTTRIRLTLDVNLDHIADYHSLPVPEVADLIYADLEGDDAPNTIADLITDSGPDGTPTHTLNITDIDHNHPTGAPTAWAQPGDTCIEITDHEGRTYTLEADTASDWADTIATAYEISRLDPHDTDPREPDDTHTVEA